MNDMIPAISGFTVADFLDLPALSRARPEVLAGENLGSRPVRWVHTSEIYDIAPLLKGNEILLTTGLGLVGASAEAISNYAHGLAQRHIAALVIEVGRTFTSLPAALITAAQDAGLPLIALRGIVPFIDITEAAHALLLSGELEHLRLGQEMTAALDTVLLAGSGMPDILRTLAALADCPVRLYGQDGHLVSSSDRQPQPVDAENPDFPHATVEVFGRPWGRLVVSGNSSPYRKMVASRGASAAAMEIGRTGSAQQGAGRARAGSRLLRDLFGRQYASVDDVTGRAAALGLTVVPGQYVAGLCFALPAASSTSSSRTTTRRPPPPSTAIIAAISGAADTIFHTSLVAELDGSYLMGVPLSGEDMRQQLTALADAIDQMLPAGSGRVSALTCGPLAPDIAGLGRSLRVAREACVLAGRLDSGLRTLLAADLGVQRLLSRFISDPELAAFVDEQLGPLIDYDASRGRELVRTLDVLLSCGLSKTAAATRLGIRRQTLYQRLETIDGLLGGLDITSRHRRTAIDLALIGWRLRTAAAPDYP